MISASLQPSGVFKSPSVDLKLLRRMKGAESPGLSGPEQPLKYSVNTVKAKAVRITESTKQTPGCV